MAVTGFKGASALVYPSGAWSLYIPDQDWSFAGSTGASLLAPQIQAASDALGAYEEIAFGYTLAGSSRGGAIRIYQDRPLILFSATLNNDAANSTPFPVFTRYPQLLHVSFDGMFVPADFLNLHNDSPAAYFDREGNTFVLSAAANFMTASLSRLADNSLASGISAQIAMLPAGFTHRTALVFGKGINNTFALWGQALLDLGGKKKPANDKGALLKAISYWTDNGASYYYNPGGASYTDTLMSIKSEFDVMGIRLGSMQLDSWWYPKGPDNSWSSRSGIWTYNASPALFRSELGGFQGALNTPLVTHARWIDAASPYRSQYQMSGNVAIDPQYWETVATYLKAAGVTTYEQDWLGSQAFTDFNLTDPSAFLGNMAASMAKRGLTIQYCMARPSHFLESTKYGNVTTARTSQDRFNKGNWTNFFYGSRLASAIGVWPFTDVFMSSETNNLLAATLSAGPLGVGDAMGSLSKDNLLRAVRADGVIVKPDVPATPVDSVFVNDALGIDAPMVAAASTNFGAGLKAWCLFVYKRGPNPTLTVTPATFGIPGAAYLYDALNDAGRLIDAHSSYTFDVTDVGYYVLSPVGPSGIAMLGDKGQFVTLGKKRIPALRDRGAAELAVSFAAGETARTIFGYSPTPVAAEAVAGTQGGLMWDSTTQMFTVNVHPAAGIARLRIAPLTVGSTKGGCGPSCALPVMPAVPSEQ